MFTMENLFSLHFSFRSRRVMAMKNELNWLQCGAVLVLVLLAIIPRGISDSGKTHFFFFLFCRSFFIMVDNSTSSRNETLKEINNLDFTLQCEIQIVDCIDTNKWQTPIQNESDKRFTNFSLMKSSKNYFIFSSALYLIICLMKSPKNCEKIVIMKN